MANGETHRLLSCRTRIQQAISKLESAKDFASGELAGEIHEAAVNLVRIEIVLNHAFNRAAGQAKHLSGERKSSQPAITLVQVVDPAREKVGA